MPTQRQSTPHVSLRAMEPDDIDMLYAVENDASLRDVGIGNVPYSRFLLTQFVVNSTGDIYTDKQLRMMVCHQDETVGIADLIDFNPQQLRAEVGIVTLRQHRRCGFALEALHQLAHYAAATLHLHQLYAYVDLGNEASLRLFEKAGYQHTATLKDWLYDGRNHRDVAFFQLFL